MQSSSFHCFNHHILRVFIITLCAFCIFIYVVEFKFFDIINYIDTSQSFNQVFPTEFDQQKLVQSNEKQSELYHKINSILSIPPNLPSSNFDYLTHTSSSKHDYNFDSLLLNNQHHDILSQHHDQMQTKKEKTITTNPANDKTIYDEQNPLKINIVIPTSCSQKDYNLRKMHELSWINYLNKSNNLWNDILDKCQIDLKYYIGDCNDNHSDKNNQYIFKLSVDEDWTNLQQKSIEMIISEYKNNNFDLLLKADTDSYINIPNLCNFMVKLMNINKWNATKYGLYLGERRDDTNIEYNHNGKYENTNWIKRTRSKTYIPFMAGFGYFLSYKSAEIVYNALSETKKDIAFNKLEDTYLGHFLSSFDVKFIDISNVIDTYMQPTIQSLNNQIIDHMYNTDHNGVLMIDKYKMHAMLHRQFLSHKD